MSFQYLKEKPYYEDTYDLHTIEECLDYSQSLRDSFAQKRSSDFKKYTDEKFEQEVNKCISRMLFAITGDRYQHKKAAIQEWMDKDKNMQEMYDNTKPPQGVVCKVCMSAMVVSLKDLHNSYEPDAHMMFIFKCTKCEKRQILFEDGTEWKYDPPKCPTCKHILKTDIKINGDITTYISICPQCGYKDKNVSDHGAFKKEQEAKEKQNTELLKKYRAQFCLSDSEGQKYIETKEALEVASVVREEERQKYDNPVYERSLQLKKTSIVALEKLLAHNLQKEKYIKMSLGKPDIGQYVIVPFTTQDSDASRVDRTSISELEKIIKAILENTNWRLVPNSVSYRLGYLQGQLKGYEQEEDMLKLAGKKEVQKPKSKIDEAQRQKYASNNLVQLARFFGESEAIENIRKRRLEKEPNGFFLNDGKVGYTCGICGETISGDNTWWDLKGIRCSDCQRNLKAGVIPLEIFDDNYGYDVVIKDWQMQFDYNIHPSTLRKLCRLGTLKSRDLKRLDGTVYERLFVVNENKDFFKEYPKKPKMKVIYKDSLGKEIQL